MTTSIDRLIVEAVTKKVISNIDIEAIANKVAPILEKELPERLAAGILENDFLYDTISELMYDKAIKTAMTAKVKTALVNAFK